MDIKRLEHATERHKTSYLSCGSVDAQPIIMLHGWPDLSIGWEDQLKFFGAQGYHAIAPDMRGYGSSSIPVNHSDYCLSLIHI